MGCCITHTSGLSITEVYFLGVVAGNLVYEPVESMIRVLQISFVSLMYNDVYDSYIDNLFIELLMVNFLLR